MSDMYPRPREDRLLEVPSSQNAQGLFSPSACVFVGNLNTGIPSEQLERDLKTLFSSLGPCHPKIKQDKKKGLPGAFVQFEKVEHAIAALELKDQKIHGRTLRIEASRARCTAVLGLCSGKNITQEDVNFVLMNQGPVISTSMMPANREDSASPWICQIQFAYVDDCRDAIKHFQKDETYFVTLLDTDNRQAASGNGFHPAQTRAPRSFTQHNDNGRARVNNERGRRQGHNSARGGGLQRPPLPHHAWFGPPPPNGLSAPSVGPNGFFYEHESQFQPCVFPYPVSNDIYSFPGPYHPGFGSPSQFDPSGNNHCIPNGPRVYNPGPPWYVPYPPSIGMAGTPSTVYSRPSDDFGPPGYTHPPTPCPSIPPATNNPAVSLPVKYNVLVENGSERDHTPESVAPGTPETDIGPEEEPQIEDVDILTLLLERKTREKAPKLIRTEGAGTDDESEGTLTVGGSKSTVLVAGLEPVPENASAEETEDGAQPIHKAIKSSTVTSESHATDTVIPQTVESTVESHVRSEAKRLKIEMGENALKEVIQELEVEMSGHKMSSESDSSSGSRSMSSSRSCSSPSV